MKDEDDVIFWLCMIPVLIIAACALNVAWVVYRG